MDKVVNGQLVNIDNIELFEKAIEHRMSIHSYGQSITDLIVDEYKKINQYILYYLECYKNIPFPLNYIEDDIKYIVIGIYILSKSNQSINMWVDNGLIIVLDETDKKVIKFNSTYWQIKTVKEIKKDNLNLDSWQDYVGYNEYEWLLRQLLNGKQTSEFYSVFMPKFTQACNEKIDIINKELKDILKFGYTPKKQQFVTNQIIDKSNNNRFMIDIYIKNIIEDNSRKTLIIQEDTVEERQNTKKIYGFNTFVKPKYSYSNHSEIDDRLKRCELPCMQQIFQRLVQIKEASGQDEFQNFIGAIIGDWLIFSVDNRIYVGDKKMSFGDIEIAEQATLHSIDNRNIYFYKTYKINDSICKRNMYSYNLRDKSIRLVNIDFIKER